MNPTPPIFRPPARQSPIGYQVFFEARALSLALMTEGSRVLHQFPISHYCEKTRWHLDLKGLSYGIKNLLPGAHAVINKRRVGMASVPVLIDGDRAIGDSSDIALYLEERYSQAPLVPKGASL